MKDVAILTKFYKNYNFGGMLQGYALCKVIKSLGYSVDIISYDVNKNINPIYPNIWIQAKQYGIKSFIFKVFEKIIGHSTFLIKDILNARINKFTQFMVDTNAGTEEYSDDTLYILAKKYKTFVSGSDQIWNPNAVRNIFLQMFNVNGKRKISYAASIGRDYLSENEMSVLIPALKCFGSISVREGTAKCILDKYIKQAITTVLDPTMLISAEEWASVSSKRIIKEKYILVYSFSNSLTIRRKIMRFAENSGCRIVTIPYAKQEYNIFDGIGPGIKIKGVGPYEFISLIKNAELVFTDSFHGAVFSLIFHIPFAVFERNKKDKVSMNSRLYDLLDTFGESDRIIDINCLYDLDKLYKFDSDKIDKVLEIKKEESLTFLQNAIEVGITEYNNEQNCIFVSTDENTCCGCGACVEVCPMGCIALKANKNGFFVPEIDSQKCVSCGKCKKACPANKNLNLNTPMMVLGAYAKNDELLSTSGGVGHIIAKSFIATGGIVYGAAYDRNLQVKIVRIDNMEDLKIIQGSKYVQADMRGILHKMVCDLHSGKKVLFTGTPCEVAGAIAVASEKNLSENLYTFDIICHGTPSPKMFSEYIEFIEGIYGRKICSYSFRYKRKCFDRDFIIHMSFSDGSESFKSGLKDPYYKAFLDSKYFRESCYECPFAKSTRVSDVTLGDFWNSEKLSSNFGKNRRISVVLINTNKGKKMLKDIEKYIEMEESSWDVAARCNTNLYRSTRRYWGYCGYGDVGKRLFQEDNESKIKLNKYIFNMLTINSKRKIRHLLNR